MSIKARIEDAKLTTINDGQDGVYECRVVIYEETQGGGETVLGGRTHRHRLDHGDVTNEQIRAGVNRFAAQLLSRYRNRVCIDCDAITLDPDL